MCTRSAAPGSAGHPANPARGFGAAVGSRRWSHRLAKRAITAYGRRPGRLLPVASPRQAPPVLVATSRPLRGEAAAAVVALAGSSRTWNSRFSGVAAAAAAGLAAAAGDAVRLTRTGGSGSFWWIELSSYGDALVLLGSQLRLSATGDGPGGADRRTPSGGCERGQSLESAYAGMERVSAPVADALTVRENTPSSDAEAVTALIESAYRGPVRAGKAGPPRQTCYDGQRTDLEGGPRGHRPRGRPAADRVE